MQKSASHTITNLLLAWGEGDHTALEALTPLVYEELYRRAQGFLSHERAGHSLQPTALINEVYVRLLDSMDVGWKNRNDFFAVCANLMRQILVDMARSHKSLKRGGGELKLSLDEAFTVAQERAAELVALDDALNTLAILSMRQSKVVELRFFGGLDVHQTATALKVSPETVMRDWKFAKLWLLKELRKV
jgi:RNA polymerase sigma factor (TIGR02999 family)